MKIIQPLLLILTGATMALASEHGDAQKALVQSVVDLFKATANLAETLQIDNYALRQALGDEASDKAIQAEIHKPMFNVGDSVTLQMNDGKEVSGRLDAIEKDQVALIDDKGAIRHVLFEFLSPQDRRRLGYDAEAHAAEQVQCLFDLLPASSPATQANDAKETSKEGLLSASAPSFHETDRDDRIVRFGWKVTLTNNADHDVKDCTVTVSFRDKNDIEIGHCLKNDNAVAQGQSISVTDTDLLETPLWDQIDHSVVSVREYR